MCKREGCQFRVVSGLSGIFWGLAISFILFVPQARAVPYYGEEVFTYNQPDGSSFGVRLYGDEFFAYQRTADDGREVVYDEATKFWCYAKLAGDGRSFVSTGVPVVTAEKGSDAKNKSRALSVGAAEPLETLPYDVLIERVKASRAKLGMAALESLNKAIGDKMAPKLSKIEGDIVGLCILVDFPDDVATISQSEVSRFLNQTSNYTGFNNACSVNEYFHIQSNGKLNYTNVVTQWIRMPHPKIYYDDNSVNSSKPAELVNTALDILTQQGFDLAGFSAINIYYAGYCSSGWTRGLWPHSAGWYQMTNMGDNLTLGTFCHENGHMICGFPDLYSYTAAALGVSASIVSDYCLMCAGGGTHPPNFCAVLKDNAGWADIVEIPHDPSPQHALLQADRNRFYKYANPDRPTEFFLLENRSATGYEGPYGAAGACVPGSGLVVWHVDKTGSNMYSSIQNPLVEDDQLFATPYYAFVVEAAPAAGKWYGNPAIEPDEFDTFYAGHGVDPLYSHAPLPVNPMFGIADPNDPDKVFLSHPDLSFWNRDDLGAGRTVVSDLVLHSFGEQGHFMPFVIGVNEGGGADWEVLAVTGSAKIGATCSSIAARCNWGQNPPSQSFRVFNTGGQGTLYFTVSSDQPWLQVSPSSGYAQPTLGGEDFSVSFDATALAAGTHLGTITVFAPDQVPATPLYIGATLKVDERPQLSVTPPTIAVSVAAKEVSNDKHIVVENTGGSTMKYTVSSSCSGSPWNWLGTAYSSGTCVGGMEDAVYLNISTQSAGMSPPVLPAGLHTGTVTVVAGGAVGSPATTTVSLTVGGFIEVAAPNGGDVWQPGLNSTVPITWATNTTDTVSIELLKWDSGSSDYVVVETIATDVPYDGDPNKDGRSIYNWTLPADITPGADYRVRVFSDGASWDVATYKDEADADLRIMRVAYSTNLSSDPNWDLEGQWAWGVPMGGGAADGVGNPDPTSGYSGSTVVGYNLAGNYANSMTQTEYATLGPVSCADFTDTFLTFRRWLGVERTDSATVEISANGTLWVPLWANPASSDVTDGDAGAWELVTYDISDYADSKPSVWVRWSMGPTDSTDRFCGWNIDDVAIHGKYSRVGALRVMLNPPAAMAAGAQWRRVGTATWRDGGDIEEDIPEGTYTVEFQDAAGWVSPTDLVVNVVGSQTTVGTGTYYQVGSLEVNIGPAEAVTAGAQWRRVGQVTWRDGGASETDIPAGTYTVEFKPVLGWIVPANRAVTVVGNQATVAAADYVEEIDTGSLRVTINPSGARAAGAQWRRTGTSVWRNSDTSEANVEVGDYTVEFKTVTGWVSPNPISVTVTKDETATGSGTYTQITGSLQVLLSPQDALLAGARWRRLGTEVWLASGATESNVPMGQLTVEFRTVAGWETPAAQSVTVNENQTTVATANYVKIVEKGSLKVTIGPVNARMAGAQWRRIGSALWHNSEATETDIEAGAHTVEFKSVAGWVTPDDVNVVVEHEETATASGSYSKATGALQVTIEPQGARDAGALWRRVESVVAKKADDVASGNVFRIGEPVLNGNVLEVPLLLFRGDDVTSQDRLDANGMFTGGPAPSAFSLDVVYDPSLLYFSSEPAEESDGKAGVEVSANLLSWYGHTITVDEPGGPNSGRIRLVFSDPVSGNQVTTADNVREGGAPEAMENPFLLGTVYFTCDLEQDTSAHLLLENLAVSDGEQMLEDAQVQSVSFKMNKASDWFASGITETDIAPGSYAVEFSEVTGWTAPEDQDVTVASGETATASGTYVESPTTGSLTVTISPSGAVTAGAKWRRVGTATWRNSGTTETDVPQGAQTVEFKDVSGWNTPANQNVTITATENTATTGVYTEIGATTGSLTVSIAPQEAVAAGAQWRRVGTATWRNSGSTETGVAAGTYTVEFRAVADWDKPANASVTVQANQTAQVSGTYTVEGGVPGCNTTMKALQPFVEVTVYEPVLPSSRNEVGMLVCGPLSPLAIRLRSDETISEDSVWGVVTGGAFESENVSWLPAAGGNGGWVVYQPEVPFSLGEVITFTAGAYTIGGYEIGPFMFDFVVDDVYEGSIAVLESGHDAGLAEFVGAAYEIHPDAVCLEPVLVQLPVPEGVDADSLEPAYLFTQNGESAWISGDHVDGWLVPGSVRVVEANDGLYVEFQVQHGGVVQLRRRVAAMESAGVHGRGISGEILLLAALGGALLLRTRVKRGSLHSEKSA